MNVIEALTKEQRELQEEGVLASYAVKSKGADRLYEIKTNKCSYRTEFQIDRDRIIHSKAFKRLMDKTQVYVTLNGDHFRNRLSHTLEVAQISKSIATTLKLNVDLVEAIALGHDLGHTPFGHAVEAVLNEKLKEENGFSHNYQSLLVTDILENKENYAHGINLTNYTRYGILNHTKDVFENLKYYNTSKDNLIGEKYKSLEAELVNLIDTVAYLCHDLDDAINCTNIFYNMQKDDSSQYTNFYQSLSSVWYKSCEIIEENKVDLKENLTNFSYNKLLKSMILDITKGTIDNINRNNIDTLSKVQNFKEKIIIFSSFRDSFDTLKNLLGKYVYNSPIANQMDTKAQFIIERLYESFINNPKQLHYATKQKYESAQKGNYLDDRKDGGYEISPNRVICNYLSGMTDRYALETYKIMFE